MTNYNIAITVKILHPPLSLALFLFVFFKEKKTFLGRSIFLRSGGNFLRKEKKKNHRTAENTL